MSYYFIRILIHRPVVCFARPTENSASVLALSDSSKHTIQILELIDERRMSLSFGINRKELIFLSGLGLLWQNMGLKRDCKLAKESQKLLSTVIDLLHSELSSAAVEFNRIANLLTPVKGSQGNTSSRPQSKDQNVSRTNSKPKQPRKQSSNSPKSQGSSNSNKSKPSNVETGNERSRSTTITNTSRTSVHSARSSSQSSTSSAHVESIASSAPPTGKPDPSADLRLDYLNLDYLPFAEDTQAADNPAMSKPGLTMEDWEHVLGDLDHGRLNIFNGIYGGSGCGDDSNTLSSLNAAFPTTTNQSQQQYQAGPLHQQRAQSTTSHSIAPSSLNDLQDWYPEDPWCSPVHSNDLHNHQLASGISSASTQSVLSYSDGSVEELPPHPGLSHGHPQRHNNNANGIGQGHLGRSNRDNGLSVDPFDGMMGPPVSSSGVGDQYGFVDGWGGR